ncbi:unnamed protein product [Linum tenue]|uniref:Replication factor A C-terminal domain-containing protein n=1 Tax=Linum tenue TaxID=586396 RepID=A0AAV0PPK3_9ROSI|nr:unnamed protein product [Linum tenue]
MEDGFHLESDVTQSKPQLRLWPSLRRQRGIKGTELLFNPSYTMAFNGIRDLESEKQLWSGHCRVSRAWLGVNVTTDKVLHFDLILMDAKGNDIWVHIPPVLQEHFKRLLKEQQVYTIKNFELHTTHLKYRPIANTYIMSFSRKTTVEHVPDVPSIPAFKFKFLKASEMASKLNDVVVLSDVVGQVVQHSDAIKTTNLARKTIRKELQLKLIEGDVVKVIIWGRVVADFDKLIKPGDDEQVILVVTAVSVKPFLGELCFNSSGSTVLYPNLDIPEVKAFTTRNVQSQQPVFVELPPPPFIPNITLSELLELQLDPDNEECVYAVECKVVGIKPFWCYMGCPTCVLKPIERHGEYYCVKCNKPTPTRAAKYRIQLDVESSSVPATFIIFEYEAKRFFGVSGNDLFNRTGQNNEVPPPDLLQIVGETKLFHVKFKLNLYSDSQADFTVLKVLEPTEQRAVSVMALRNLAQLNLHDNDQAVRVRLLRLWHTMRPDGVTLDQIHMLFLDNQLFAPLLHVGRIYFLSNFLVQEYDDTYRVAPATIRIRFHNDTVIEELQNAADIPTYSFRFLAANDLPFAVHNHEYLSDLIGEVETVEQEEVLFEDAAILRRKGVQLRLIDIENVSLAIDYTLEDAIWLSEICSISELNLYKTDFTNQGNLYLTTATVKDVTVSWSSVHLKFMVRLTVATGPHEASIMFMTTKFRWIASRIIEATDKEWTNDFRTLLAALRGNILKFMIEFGDFNGQTNEFDLVLHKLFW